MRFKDIIIASVLTLIICSCYKDNVNLDTLNTNPWDLDFDGADLIKIDTAYFDSIHNTRYIFLLDTADQVVDTLDTIYSIYYTNHITLSVQAHVDPDRFKESYEIKVEPTAGISEILKQDPSLDRHTFKYEKSTQDAGVTFCYSFTLTRKESPGNGISFCNTSPY